MEYADDVIIAVGQIVEASKALESYEQFKKLSTNHSCSVSTPEAERIYVELQSTLLMAVSIVSVKAIQSREGRSILEKTEKLAASLKAMIYELSNEGRLHEELRLTQA